MEESWRRGREQRQR